MISRTTTTGLTAALMVACASQDEEIVVRLPTEQQVNAYVPAHWQNFGPRFAQLSGRPWDTPSTFVAVKNVTCYAYYAFAECTFDLTAHFENAEPRTINTSSNFDWDDHGEPKEVFVLIERRAH